MACDFGCNGTSCNECRSGTSTCRAGVPADCLGGQFKNRAACGECTKCTGAGECTATEGVACRNGTGKCSGSTCQVCGTTAGQACCGGAGGTCSGNLFCDGGTCATKKKAGDLCGGAANECASSTCKANDLDGQLVCCKSCSGAASACNLRGECRKPPGTSCTMDNECLYNACQPPAGALGKCTSNQPGSLGMRINCNPTDPELAMHCGDACVTPLECAGPAF
jgi:hypothetical protein